MEDSDLTPRMQSLFSFFAVQIARIHTQLYPYTSFPKHVRGPKKPDMQDQERKF